MLWPTLTMLQCKLKSAVIFDECALEWWSGDTIKDGANMGVHCCRKGARMEWSPLPKRSGSEWIGDSWCWDEGWGRRKRQEKKGQGKGDRKRKKKKWVSKERGRNTVFRHLFWTPSEFLLLFFMLKTEGGNTHFWDSLVSLTPNGLPRTSGVGCTS